jgi:hypothetical protein
MQDWQVQLMLQAQAVIVRVEGMKAENQHCLFKNMAPTYTFDYFYSAADEINGIAQAMAI